MPIDNQVPSQEAEQQRLQHRETVGAEALGESSQQHTTIPSLGRMRTWTMTWKEVTDSLMTRGSASVERSDGMISVSLWMT